MQKPLRQDAKKQITQALQLTGTQHDIGRTRAVNKLSFLQRCQGSSKAGWRPLFTQGHGHQVGLGRWWLTATWWV